VAVFCNFIARLFSFGFRVGPIAKVVGLFYAHKKAAHLYSERPPKIPKNQMLK